VLVKGRKGLVEIGLPSVAKKPCFHCDKQLQNKTLFFWFGSEPLVMHALCFADWMRRAQRDLDNFIEGLK
jgi:hypothetical protein